MKIRFEIILLKTLYFLRSYYCIKCDAPHYHCVISQLSIGFCIIFDRVMGFDCLLIDARARWCHDIISPKKCLNTIFFHKIVQEMGRCFKVDLMLWKAICNHFKII